MTDQKLEPEVEREIEETALAWLSAPSDSAYDAQSLIDLIRAQRLAGRADMNRALESANVRVYEQNEEIDSLRASVETLTRERDEMSDGVITIIRRAERAEQDRDEARAEAARVVILENDVSQARATQREAQVREKEALAEVERLAARVEDLECSHLDD